MLCYDATTLLTCVNNTFTVMHILADAFTQNYIDFYQFTHIPRELKPLTFPLSEGVKHIISIYLTFDYL